MARARKPRTESPDLDADDGEMMPDQAPPRVTPEAAAEQAFRALMAKERSQIAKSHGFVSVADAHDALVDLAQRMRD